MLRVVIADDEERIIKLIQVLADWDRLRMEVVGTASDGPHALSLVEGFVPDILITDIRMPGLDGLELISRAKSIAPLLEVIIISGYAQFDYAQTAIQYGVGDYLLKPINKHALNNTLERMSERCRARKTSVEEMERLRESALDDCERLRVNLVTDLLSGSFSAADATQMEETYRFVCHENTYQVFLLKMDYDLEHFGEASLDIVRGKAKDLLCPILSAYCADSLLESRGAVLFGVMHYAFDAQSAIRKRLRECLNQLVALRSLFGSVDFSMALGQAVRTPSALTESFDNARANLSERLAEGTGRLLEGTRVPSGIQEAALMARYIQEATRAIDVFDLAEAERAADMLEASASAVQGVLGRELLKLVRGAGSVFIARLGMDGHDQALSYFEAHCDQCGTAAELFGCLKALQRGLLLQAVERQRSRDGHPIRIAKQYMQKHFATPLTLEEVSAATGFSVNYFSTLFKKETGEGFAKYLARVRIEAAKGLLRETQLPVAEVCRQVGYGDIKHFTRTFRTETGITPGEFRKLYG